MELPYTPAGYLNLANKTPRTKNGLSFFKLLSSGIPLILSYYIFAPGYTPELEGKSLLPKMAYT